MVEVKQNAHAIIIIVVVVVVVIIIIIIIHCGNAASKQSAAQLPCGIAAHMHYYAVRPRCPCTAPQNSLRRKRPARQARRRAHSASPALLPERRRSAHSQKPTSLRRARTTRTGRACRAACLGHNPQKSITGPVPGPLPGPLPARADESEAIHGGKGGDWRACASRALRAQADAVTRLPAHGGGGGGLKPLNEGREGGRERGRERG